MRWDLSTKSAAPALNVRRDPRARSILASLLCRTRKIVVSYSYYCCCFQRSTAASKCEGFARLFLDRFPSGDGSGGCWSHATTHRCVAAHACLQVVDRSLSRRALRTNERIAQDVTLQRIFFSPMVVIVLKDPRDF